MNQLVTMNDREKKNYVNWLRIELAIIIGHYHNIKKGVKMTNSRPL